MRKIILMMLVVGTFLFSCKEEKKEGEGGAAVAVAPILEDTFISPNNSFCTLINEEVPLRYGITHGPRSLDNVYAYKFSELKAGRDSFDTNFKFGRKGETKLVNADTKLSLAAFDSLNKYVPLRYDSKKNYAALKMHYGIEKQTMVLIFEPIALVPILSRPNTCDTINSSKYFRVFDGKLKQITQVELKTLTKMYTDSIYIDHKLDSQRSIKTFVDNNSDFEKGDIHYCIMPMQQIFKMYLDNANNADCKKLNLSDAISFSLIANNYYKTNIIKEIKNYKLHIVTHFGLNEKTIEGNSKIFDGLGSDFAELCPPNCNTVGINYYPITK
jgi:hypothetical protein